MTLRYNEKLLFHNCRLYNKTKLQAVRKIIKCMQVVNSKLLSHSQKIKFSIQCSDLTLLLGNWKGKLACKTAQKSHLNKNG